MLRCAQLICCRIVCRSWRPQLPRRRSRLGCPSGWSSCPSSPASSSSSSSSSSYGRFVPYFFAFVIHRKQIWHVYRHHHHHKSGMYIVTITTTNLACISSPSPPQIWHVYRHHHHHKSGMYTCASSSPPFNVCDPDITQKTSGICACPHWSDRCFPRASRKWRLYFENDLIQSPSVSCLSLGIWSKHWWLGTRH